MSDTVAAAIIRRNHKRTRDGDDIISEAQSDAKRQELPAYDPARSRVIDENTGSISASHLVTLEDENYAKAAFRAELGDIDVTQEIDENLRAIMEAKDEVNQGHYKNPCYFAQVGPKSGFTYLLQSGANAVIPLRFENGVLAVTDIGLVRQIRNDIANNAAISTQIIEITARQYRDQLEAGEVARSLIARSGGLVNSNSVRSDERALIAQQQSRIAELEAKLAASTANSPAK